MFSSARARRVVAGLALLLLVSACAGVSFQRTTETSGTFSSYGLALTILSSDFPKGALQIARENAADANLANMEVRESFVVPYLGPVDFLLDIVGIRYAHVSGTWGFAGN